jgi:ATP-binding cassette subfamily B protein
MATSPTAAIDARTEYGVFVRLNQLMAGRMVAVMSHHFSTMRRTDRIVVLCERRVLDEGWTTTWLRRTQSRSDR